MEILRKTLEFKCKGTKPMAQPRIEWFSWILCESKNRGRASKKLKRNDYGKADKVRDFLSLTLGRSNQHDLIYEGRSGLNTRAPHNIIIPTT
jgi:hypothetical protein